MLSAVRPSMKSTPACGTGRPVAHQAQRSRTYRLAVSLRRGVRVVPRAESHVRDQPCSSQISGRFSYAVDSTVVVWVEHFASARIRASSHSRADMVGTWTLSR